MISRWNTSSDHESSLTGKPTAAYRLHLPISIAGLLVSIINDVLHIFAIIHLLDGHMASSDDCRREFHGASMLMQTSALRSTLLCVYINVYVSVWSSLTDSNATGSARSEPTIHSFVAQNDKQSRDVVFLGPQSRSHCQSLLSLVSCWTCAWLCFHLRTIFFHAE